MTGIDKTVSYYKIGRPICKHCGRLVPDPDAGTVNAGVYEVRCECGAWLELLRDVDIHLTVRQSNSTVPPRVFLGSDTERAPAPDDKEKLPE